MFNYFTQKKNKTIYPIKKYSSFDTIQRKYKLEIDRVKLYYRHRDRAVNNNNMLARILDLIAPDTSAPIVDIFKQIGMRAKYLSKQFDIVSTLAKGKVHNNVLYKENSKEIFIYVENDIDLINYENLWKESVPIRIVYTNNRRFDYTFPYRQSFDVIKTTVFEIDLTAMTLQYSMWCKERKAYNKSTDSNVYIATYVMPNILDQYMDITIFNRFIELSLTEDLETSFKHRHPFHVVNYTNDIDRVLKGVYKDVSNVNIPIDQLVNSIPTFSGNDMFDILRLNQRYYNTQSEWVLWVTRIKYVYQLLVVMGKRGRATNLSLVNKLPVIFRYLENRASRLEDALNEDMLEEFNTHVKKIKELVGKR